MKITINSKEITTLKENLKAAAQSFETLNRALGYICNSRIRMQVPPSVRPGSFFEAQVDERKTEALFNALTVAEDSFDQISRMIDGIESFELDAVDTDTAVLNLNQYREKSLWDTAEDTVRVGVGLCFKITNARIEAVQAQHIRSLTDAQNELLTRRCKELLRMTMDDAISTERAFLLSREMRVLCRLRQLDITASPQVSYSNIPNLWALIHNHPAGGPPSKTDLEAFASASVLRIFGAVGNNGKTYFLEKTEEYDYQKFAALIGKHKGMRDIVPELRDCGINYYVGGELQSE